MSDYTITGAVATFNKITPLMLEEETAADITVTLTTAGTVAFPITISAQITTVSADVITWTSIVPDTPLGAPPIEFTVTAQASNVLQPVSFVSQNYLVTTTDSDARTQVFNIAVDNDEGYPTATLEVIDGYPNPSGAAVKPEAPTALVAMASSATEIDLTWVAPVVAGSTPISGYQIERESPTGGGFAIIVSDTTTTTTTYSDTGLTTATEYNYRVSAINTSGVGAVSNAASDTTL